MIFPSPSYNGNIVIIAAVVVVAVNIAVVFAVACVSVLLSLSSIRTHDSKKKTNRVHTYKHIQCECAVKGMKIWLSRSVLVLLFSPVFIQTRTQRTNTCTAQTQALAHQHTNNCIIQRRVKCVSQHSLSNRAAAAAARSEPCSAYKYNASTNTYVEAYRYPCNRTTNTNSLVTTKTGVVSSRERICSRCTRCSLPIPYLCIVYV